MRTLGGTGIKVSPYCLGAMMFGAWGNRDHEESIRIIHAALEAGINFIDTADVYSAGESEVIVGQALLGRRDEVVLATKAHGSMGEDPNMSGNSRRWIVREVENSLRRLQTDYIDLYQMHRPDPDTDISETLSALSDLVRAGKVRVIGASAGGRAAARRPDEPQTRSAAGDVEPGADDAVSVDGCSAATPACWPRSPAGTGYGAIYRERVTTVRSVKIIQSPERLAVTAPGPTSCAGSARLRPGPRGREPA